MVSFGTSASGDDNDPYDMVCGGTEYPYYYDDDETFSCDEDVCGTETTNTIVTDDTFSELDEGMRGNVFLADANGTIHDFEFYGYALDGEGCEVDFYILSAASTSATSWTVEWTEAETITDDDEGWLSSGEVGFPVEVGTYYALVMGWECDDDELGYAYENTSSVGEDMGMGDTVGRWVSNDYDADTSSIDSEFAASNYLYYSNLTWSH